MGDGQKMRGGDSILGKGEAIAHLPSVFSLQEKVAVVVGAGGGLGRAISLALASAGAEVVAVGHTSSMLEDTCAEIEGAGKSAVAYEANIAEPKSVAGAMAWVYGQHNRLDIVVNAAGVQLRKAALDVTPDDWERMIDVNLKGVFFCCQAAAKFMAERGGSIINLTSLASVIGLPSLSVYGACKGGVTQLVKTLAVEWASLGIRVNAIGPGRIRTPMTDSLFEDESVRESFLALIPQGRPGVPDDLAGAAIFLASDAAAYMTGQTLYIEIGSMQRVGNSSGGHSGFQKWIRCH